MGVEFQWFFGDGSHTSGNVVHHRFQDADGTLLDGSGRFRILLHLKHSNGKEAWGSQYLVLTQKSVSKREKITLAPRPEDRMEKLTFDVPIDGGYTFTLLTSTEGQIWLDDVRPLRTPKARPQVCGSLGNAVQPVQQSMVLTKGPHTLQVQRDLSIENAVAPLSSAGGSPLVLWEGPGITRQVLVNSEDKRYKE